MEKKYSSYWTIKAACMVLMIIWPSLYSGAFGQQPSLVDAYLSGAYDELRVKRYEQELTFLSDKPIKSSWVREIEVRARAKHYSEQVEDYRFRISPTNPWEIQANKSYQSQLQKVSEINYSITIAKELKARYQRLITSYYQFHKLNLIQKELEIKNLALENDMTDERGLDPVDLIEIESKITELEIKKTTLELEHQEINSPIKKEVDSIICWPKWEMISPATIMDLIYSGDKNNLKNIHKHLADSKLDLKEKMLQINKAESFGNIGFVQANMDLGQGSTFDDHMGFQVGVSIPIVNRKKADLARDQFDLIETKNDAAQTHQEVDIEVDEILERITSIYALYQLINEKIARSEIIKSRINQAPTPSAILKIEQYRIDLQDQKNTIYKQLLMTYLEYLDKSGTLARDASLNYLSPDLSKIY